MTKTVPAKVIRRQKIQRANGGKTERKTREIGINALSTLITPPTSPPSSSQNKPISTGLIISLITFIYSFE